MSKKFKKERINEWNNIISFELFTLCDENLRKISLIALIIKLMFFMSIDKAEIEFVMNIRNSNQKLISFVNFY